MVLSRGFEPPTSPLPRECSTPELRQHMTLCVGGISHRLGMCSSSFFRKMQFDLTLRRTWGTYGAMSKEMPKQSSQKQEEKQKKQDRLAEALRANLRRRKTQSRARKTPSEPDAKE